MSAPSNGRKSDGTFTVGNKGGGRPKMPEELKEAFKAHTMEALDALLDVMNNKGEKGAARVSAATVILDRGWGRAQVMEDSTDSAAAIVAGMQAIADKLTGTNGNSQPS